MTDYSKTFGMAPTPVTMVPAPVRENTDGWARDYSTDYMRDHLRKSMQAAPHTQGSLHVCSHSDKRLRDFQGDWIADADSAAEHSKERSSANARRLAACWNACEGFSTGALEQDTFMASLRKSSDTIREMSAQLFAFHAERERLRAELIALRLEREQLWSIVMPMDDGPAVTGEAALRDMRERATILATRASSAGVVLTVEQRPRTPLAMGNYETVVSVRAARGSC